ncbi:MAG: hypothetical protein NTV38_05225, partial [Chloroflexi bacterium]|nr:hypothetical protein [Chloroflexota bacterium]
MSCYGPGSEPPNGLASRSTPACTPKYPVVARRSEGDSGSGGTGETPPHYRATSGNVLRSRA